MEVRLNKTSFRKGIEEEGIITVICEGVEKYSQIQVEIFNTGIINPASVLGFGASPTIQGENIYETSFKIDSFGQGSIYEIKIVLFHTIVGMEFSSDQAIFSSGKDFERLFFEVIDEKQESRNSNQMEKIVLEKEKQNEYDFLSGIDIRENIHEDGNEFTVFVIVKNLLVGIGSRLDKYEIIPFRGMDKSDDFSLVNDFLNQMTVIRLGEFLYSQEEQENCRNQNPVSVVHFPYIISSEIEKAKDFCVKKVVFLLQSLSLQRGASGEISQIMIYDHRSGDLKMFSNNGGYRGNLLTGRLSGEIPEMLQDHIRALEEDPFKSFLVDLYKEALAENNPNFKYVRYWQILEVLAESKNYNKEEDLLDFEGKIINKQNEGKNELKNGEPIPLKLNSAGSIVFNLLKNHQIGNTKDTWEKVNIWLSFRDTVAHYGSIEEYGKLRSKKNYAQIGIDKIQHQHGYDPIIGELEDNVKHILMRELNRSGNSI